MQNSEFNFTGSQLSVIGQQLAIDTADAVINNWSTGAYKLLLDYIKCHGSIPFKAEDARLFIEDTGYPVPPSKRSWGHLFSRARVDGVIKSAGTTKVINPRCHSAYCTLWERV